MLDQALPVLCNGICSADGITFVMSGNQAYTDFKRIVVPQLDITQPRCITLGLGFTMHERGHIIHTDPSSMKPFQDDKGNIVDELGHSVWNKIEDVRMEMRSWTDFAGAKRILNNLATAVVEDAGFAPICDQDSPVTLLQKLILYYARGFVARQAAVKELLDNGASILEAKLPTGLIVRVKAMLGTIPSLKDAHGSTRLALELKDVFEEESEPKPKPKPNPAPSSGSSSPSSGGAPDNPEEVSKRQALRNSLRSLSKSDIVQSDMGELVAKALNQASRDYPNKIVPIANVFQGPKKHNPALIREALDLSNVLKRRLLNLLEAQTDVSYKHAEDGDDLDDQRLVDVMFGELEIFLERRQVSVGHDTEIRLILDRSRSMSSIIHLASVITLGIALTLDQVEGINCSATAFPYNTHDVLMLCDREGVRGQSDRFDLSVGGCTPMASALWQAVLDICQSPRQRKIVMIITDGDPDPVHHQPTLELINMAEENGIEMIGIGIGTNAHVDRYFGRYVKVGTVNNLSPALFGLLRNMLV